MPCVMIFHHSMCLCCHPCSPIPVVSFRLKFSIIKPPNKYNLWQKTRNRFVLLRPCCVSEEDLGFLPAIWDHIQIGAFSAVERMSVLHTLRAMGQSLLCSRSKVVQLMYKRQGVIHTSSLHSDNYIAVNPLLLKFSCSIWFCGVI